MGESQPSQLSRGGRRA